MSCVSFLSPAQRAAMAEPSERRTVEEIQAQHPAPPVTEGKLRRLALLAKDADPKIRESAALNYHCPVDVLRQLAKDADVGVRGGVARNPGTPRDLLQTLATDPAIQVRTWVAANPSADQALLDLLAEDTDPTMQRVVTWARNWTQA